MRAAPPQRFEIRMVQARVGHANYPRPCIVAEVLSDGTARVFYLSTKDYSERGQSFRIRSDHPDFAATGLKATSYTVFPPERIPISLLGSKKGDLTGTLATEFEDWLG